jgi:ferrochelatase
MAYGTPETLDQVEPYFTHIRGGRTPSPEAIERLKQRYQRVGGRTPLLEITRAVASELERVLNTSRDPGDASYRVYVGMKHWHPFIAETMRDIVADGVQELTALTLAPHYSRISIGGYRKALDEAQADLGSHVNVTFVESWHQQPEFIAFMGALIDQALLQFTPEQRASVVAVFSAHSLPVRIREWNDPYEQELLSSSESVAKHAGLPDWRFAWQSAGETGEAWLGPDILDYLETLHAEGVRNVLQIPIGFVSDHLEILWDLDVEAKNKSADLGITYHRTQLPNANPDFVRAIAAVITTAQRSSAAPHASA